MVGTRQGQGGILILDQRNGLLKKIRENMTGGTESQKRDKFTWSNHTFDKKENERMASKTGTSDFSGRFPPRLGSEIQEQSILGTSSVKLDLIF